MNIKKKPNLSIKAKNLNKRQKVIDYFKDNGEVTSTLSLGIKTGLSYTYLKKILLELLKDNIIVKISCEDKYYKK